MTLRALTIAAVAAAILAAPAVARPPKNKARKDARAAAFTPKDLGDKLWSWCWAGEKGEHATVQKKGYGPAVVHLKDLSGKGNHFRGRTKGSAYQVGLKLPAKTKGGAYQTHLPIVGVDEYTTGKGRRVYGNGFTLEPSFAADGEFYLVAVCMNTRDAGDRELWGLDQKNVVRLDQRKDSVGITIAGQQKRLVPKGKLPKGIMVLEIWRDKGSRVTCFGNGKDITNGTVVLPGNFDLKGLGYDGKGSSQWDDYWMEFVMCKVLPDETERANVREYLRAKWGVWKKG